MFGLAYISTPCVMYYSRDVYSPYVLLQFFRGNINFSHTARLADDLDDVQLLCINQQQSIISALSYTHTTNKK